jgi:hypothetical protein
VRGVGRWLRGDLMRFVVIVCLLMLVSAVALALVGGVTPVVVGVVAVLGIALLTAVYVGGVHS